MKKLWLILILIILLLLVATWRVSEIDWTNYRPQLESQISQALDAEVKLNGKLSIAFLPTPKLEAENAFLHARGVEIRAPSLRLAAKLWPLIGGKIILSSAEIIEPDIRVVPEIWRPGHRKRPLDAGAVTPIQLEKVTVEDGRIAMEMAGRSEQFDAVNLELYAPDWHGPYHVEGDFLWRDLPVDFELSLGVVTPAGSRPLALAINQTDVAPTLNWHGAFIATPFALRGEWQGDSSAIMDTAAAQKKPADRCPPGSLIDLTACFLFLNTKI